MAQSDILKKPLRYLKGVGDKRASLLASELDLHTYNDLLHFFPNRYVDRSRFYKIAELNMAPAEVQVKGEFISFREEGGGNKKRLVAEFADDTGSMELIWFKNYKWVERTYQKGRAYVIYGKLNWFGNRVSVIHPEVELLSQFQLHGHLGLVPVYPSTEKLVKKGGLTNKIMRKIMFNLFEETGRNFPETLPGYLIDKLRFISRSDALYRIHFPSNLNELAKAQYRLKFEELFYLQMQLLYHRQQRKTKIKGHVFNKIGDYFNRFYHEVLPFELTGAQKRVIKEIRRDVKTGAQMNRLVQGDVGSGKTVVAMMSMLMALDNGFQAAMLAPTEILAQQHYFNLKKWAEALEIRMALLTGSTKPSERRELLPALENGEIQIIVGTHALIEDKVKFKNLGLAVIDEQHRFGVAQRAKMWKKNTIPPHILIMTATPIPRTLAMTHYGDLDVSVIDELPPGRKPVKTVHMYDRQRTVAYDFIRKQVYAGRQAYIVFPLIEESEVLNYENLTEGYERVQEAFASDGFKIGMVHGAMKPAEKEEVMRRFKEGEIQILVATTVIEVGVDVPNANVMLIESAQRFGLSQLHQLRGRVGRGADAAYCILMTDSKLSDDAKTRIKTMVETTDGFRIAEVDLKLRGPGNIMGTKQSGIIRLKIADFVRDVPLMQHARAEANRILDEDPALQQSENAVVKKVLEHLLKKTRFWSYIG